MIDKKLFGEQIRFYRNKIGLTQNDLANKLHVTFQAISSWECGNTLPDIENLCDLSSVLGVSLDVLLKAQSYTGEKIFISVDGSSNSTEFALFTSAGHVLKCFKLQGTNASTIGLSSALSIYYRGIDICLTVNKAVQGIFIGCAGGLMEDVSKNLSQKYSWIPIHIDSNGVNALLSADGDAAMVCGTGTVFFRHEPDGGYRKFAGWGHILGDFGSAYHFGKAAICAAKAYEEGIESSPLIYSILKDELGTQSINKATNDLKDIAAIAQKASVIFRAYALGDAFAENIIHNEMKLLAWIARSVCQDGGKIIACGGINQHYGDVTLPILKQYVPENIEFILPELPPIYGASREACHRFGVSTDENFYKNFSSDYK